MSDQPFGEAAGTAPDPSTAPAPGSSPAASTAPPAPQRQFTPEELQAAREQLIAAGDALGAAAPAGPGTSDEALGAQLAADGAAPDEVDAASLLRSIRSLQAQVDSLQKEKRLSQAPDVVKYTTAIADHLQARADMHPVIHADPDHTWMPALEQAASVVNAATDAASSGDPARVLEGLDRLRKFFSRHGRRFPAMDYGYFHELADEAEEAARKLAA